jgi:hypothetical protein
MTTLITLNINMKEFFEYTILQDYQEKYKLECQNKQVTLDITYIGGRPLEYIDNPTYIFETLYPILKLWCTEKKVEDGEEFGEIAKIIDIQDFELIFNMLNRSIELNWNK